MTIGRMQMNRQLYAGGGIYSLVPREKFGLGSSLKKFARKIIPNEISKAAVKLAPFVATFDPATAALMSSVGTFDQTGSISGSLKSGAMIYGAGQLGRVIGGAGAQALPGTAGFTGQSLLSPASYSSGIMNALNPFYNTGLTSPIGSGSPIGEYLQGKGVPRVEGVGIDPGASGTYVDGVFQPSTDTLASLSKEAARTAPQQVITSGTTDIDQFGSIQDYLAQTDPSKLTPAQRASEIAQQAGKTLSERAAREGYIELGKRAIGGDTDAMLQIAKNVGSDIFYKVDPKTGKEVLDKQATLAIILGAKSYLEAKEEDPTITESTYDEVKKAAKKAEYEDYTANFATKRADGGRIGYAEGTSPQMSMAVDMIKKGMDEETISSITQLSVDQIKQIKQNMTRPDQRANGGRIGYAGGSDDKTIPISGDEFKKILEEFMKNQEKQEKMRRENKYKGGRMGYAEGTSDEMFSPTDSDEEGISGVVYKDPKTGETLTIKEFLRRADEDENKDKKKTFRERSMEIAVPKQINREMEDRFENYLKKLITGKKDGGRINYREGTPKEGIVSLTDEDSGVVYRDPKTGESLTTTEFLRRADEDEFGSESMMMPPEKPRNMILKEKVTNLEKARGILEPSSYESILENMLKSNNMSKEEYDSFIEQLKSETMDEETRITKAIGGRANFAMGTPEQTEKMKRDLFQMTDNPDFLVMEDPTEIYDSYMQRTMVKKGGSMKKSKGIMDCIPVRLNKKGVKELDFRPKGGFVPVGVKERADDVPAMLSKNEFVFTAKAVRNAGDGDINKGAKKMYALMKQLEKKKVKKI
jgi:hypothetical protein